MSNSPVSVRRYDLDWLRVIAFFLLIYYHTAILFTPGGIPMIQNSDTSELLSLLADFLHEFRLALLFLISGVGIAFARRRRSEREFLKERSVRLLVPMIFGIAVIVPPMIYLEKLFLNTFEGSFVLLCRLLHRGRLSERTSELAPFLVHRLSLSVLSYGTAPVPPS